MQCITVVYVVFAVCYSRSVTSLSSVTVILSYTVRPVGCVILLHIQKWIVDCIVGN